jgi:hypothetical protein
MVSRIKLLIFILIGVGVNISNINTAFCDEQNGDVLDVQQQFLHCPAPGSSMISSTGRRTNFIGSDGIICDVEFGGRKIKTIAGLWWFDQPGAPEAVESFRAMMPIKGSNIRFAAPGNAACPTCVWYETISIEGTETVTVAAGTFKTVIFKWNETGEGHDHNIWWWYSPDVGYVIKQKVKYIGGKIGKKVDWEATELQGFRQTPTMTSNDCPQDFYREADIYGGKCIRTPRDYLGYPLAGKPWELKFYYDDPHTLLAQWHSNLGYPGNVSERLNGTWYIKNGRVCLKGAKDEKRSVEVLNGCLNKEASDVALRD